MKKIKILLLLLLTTFLTFGQNPDVDILQVASGFNRPVDFQNHHHLHSMDLEHLLFLQEI